MQHQRRLAPLLAFHAEFQDGAQLVVPIAENIGLDFQSVTENALDRMTPTIKFGFNVFDRNPYVGPPRHIKA